MEGYENVQAALLDYTLTCYPSVDVSAVNLSLDLVSHSTDNIFLFGSLSIGEIYQIVEHNSRYTCVGIARRRTPVYQTLCW